MTEAASPRRAAYVVRVGKKYWTRDRERNRKKGKTGIYRGFKDFYRAGIITTPALAKRIANFYKGKIETVSITRD